ncbi:MAG TPA: hypothetical protein VFV19_03160 [Candidatus Polarisedimenticolaceae bacterium]|nr:hypothetical protein [Candidatus Polarisedimenticolaceae bacterium]
MTPSKAFALSALLALLAACTNVSAPTDSSSSSPPPSGPGGPTSLSGTWDATLTVTGGNALPKGTKLTGTIVLVADTDTNALSGTLTLSNGIAGTIQGAQAGNGFVMTTTETLPCHSGSFDTPDGRVNDAFTQLTGTFDGRDCNGKLVAALAAVRRS